MPAKRAAASPGATTRARGKEKRERLSRNARPPAPSDAVKDGLWRVANIKAAALQDAGYRRMPKRPPVRYTALAPSEFVASNGGSSGAGAVAVAAAVGSATSTPLARETAQAMADAAAVNAPAPFGDGCIGGPVEVGMQGAHIMRLHSCSVDNSPDCKVQQWLAYERSLPLRHWDVAGTAFKSATQRGAVTQKEAGQGSTQQTPRVNRIPVLTAWCAEAVSTATVLGMAQQAVRGAALVDTPACSDACDVALLVHEALPGGLRPAVPPHLHEVLSGVAPLVLASTARLVQHALPRRLCKTSFLTTMKALARDQLANFCINDQNHPLEVICNHIVHDHTGMNVWASWALVEYLVTEPRAREFARARLGDLDVATALVCLEYGEKEIRWRERKTQNAEARRAAMAKARREARVQAPRAKRLRLGDQAAAEPAAAAAAAATSSDGSPSLSSTTSVSTAAVAPELDEELEGEEADAEEADGESEDDELCSDDGGGGGTGTDAAPGVLAEMAVATTPTSGGRSLGEHVRAGQYGRATQKLAFWADACSFSKHKVVLQMMVTQKASTAAAATVETIASQCVGNPASLLQDDSTVLAVGCENAVRSAKVVAGLIQTTDAQVPRIVAWKVRAPANPKRVEHRVGLVRSTEDAEHTMLHACMALRPDLRPARPHVVCLWSQAQRLLSPPTPQTTLVPGLVETERYAAALQAHIAAGGDPRDLGFVSRMRVDQALGRLHATRTHACREGSMRMGTTGVARGAITILATLVCNRSQQERAAQVAAQLMRHHDDLLAQAPPTLPLHVAAQEVRSEELQGGVEPLVTPGNNLVLALEVDAAVRKIVTKDRKGNPCVRLCGPATRVEIEGGYDASDGTEADGGGGGAATAASSAPRQREDQKHTHTTYDLEQPAGILPIIDVQLRFFDGPEQARPLPSRPQDAVLRTAAVTLVVAGDAPVRVVDLVANFATLRTVHLQGERPAAAAADADADADAAAAARSRTLRVGVRLRARALLLAAAARALELNDLARFLTAGGTNARIAAAKRDTSCDLTLNLHATLHNVYRVGHATPRSYASSSHSGNYPAGFDLGLLAHIGIKAFKYTSDQRGHGKMQISQSMVDKLATRFAEKLWMPVCPGYMDRMPVEARGVVHLVVPMLHAHLNDLVDAMELARAVMGIQDRDTCDSLQCLAFTPFADRRTAWAGPDDDSATTRFRNPLDAQHHENRAFTLDATVDDVSIMEPTTFPRQAVTCASNNLFETPDLFFSAFLGIATLLGEMAVDAVRSVSTTARAVVPGAEAMELLHAACCAYHADTDADVDAEQLPDLLYAADALPLLDLLYPVTTEINQKTILAAWAAGPALQYPEVRAGRTGKRLAEFAGVAEADKAAARQRWGRFARADRTTCTWRAALAPFVAELIDANGKYDSSLDELARMRTLQMRAMRYGAFFAASPDGRKPPEAPSALQGVRGPHQVRPEHLRPVFAGREIGASGRRVEARGPVAGTMPMAAQLVLHMMLAARLTVEDDYEPGSIHAQYKRNEGGVCVRPSSSAIYKTAKGKDRSEKAVAPIMVEGDSQAFGDFAEKERLAILSREASDANVEMAAPLLLAIAEPRHYSVLRRGDCQFHENAMQRRRLYTANGQTFSELKHDDALFAAAARMAAAAAP